VGKVNKHVIRQFASVLCQIWIRSRPLAKWIENHNLIYLLKLDIGTPCKSCLGKFLAALFLEIAAIHPVEHHLSFEI
jgi:hypothetical protein